VATVTTVTAENERRRFVFPPVSGSFDDIELELLDPADEHDRSMLILAEHPELQRAIDADLDEIHLHGTTMNPRLHLLMHEVVANQLWDDDPPEVWQTAQRLRDAGYERHEILHMLASVTSNAVYETLHDNRPADPAAVRQGLAALPESWEQQRADIPGQRHANRAERRAAQRRHRK
jgi:hydroxypyruvate isomerase